MAASRRDRPAASNAGGLGIRVTRRRLLPPLPKAHFRVFLGRVEVGVLSVSSLDWLTVGEVDPEVRQTVALRRAVGQDRTFYDWYRAVASGKVDVRPVTVVQLDCPDGAAINIWQLEKAIPVRWTGPDFDALSDGMGTEELELRYDSVTWRNSA